MRLKININILFFLFLIFGTVDSYSQPPKDNDQKLASHYYDKGEFAKAEIYYEKLHKKYKNFAFFERYFNCLFYQEKYGACEKITLKQIKRDPFTIDYKFMLAHVYEETGRDDDAQEVYQNLIKDISGIQSQIDELGKAFKSRGMYELSLQTYLKGKEKIKGYEFQLELAELYSLLDQPYEMIQEYLNLLDYSPVYVNSVQLYLSRIINFETDVELVNMLREELLIRIQEHPNKDYYNEMLIWFYLHKKEFKGAVIQAKALDKKKKLKGQKVYQIAVACKRNEAFDAANLAYQYIIDLGSSSPYYVRATQNILEIKFIQITEKGVYSDGELLVVANEFEDALNELGKSNSTVGMIINLVKIYAFYLNQTEKAEQLIKESLKLQLAPKNRAILKILLGDIYIVSDKIWDASILYMQVEKEFSEDIIGHEAKFKNAKVFYYDGEFEYAKAQLDVLKASTSKLIANDAMQLSLLLQDNMVMDTTRAPIEMYAMADLLIQQNKFDEAFLVLDSIAIKYPFHSLVDEVLFKKAEIYEHLQNWDKAIEYYTMVSDSYGFDILGDDATFRIAKIYDNRLNDKAKAAEWYRKILFDFKGSLHTSESLNRYNALKEFI